MGLKLDAKAGISFLPATHQHRFAEHWQAHDCLAQARGPSLLRKRFNNAGKGLYYLADGSPCNNRTNKGNQNCVVFGLLS